MIQNLRLNSKKNYVFLKKYEAWETYLISALNAYLPAYLPKTKLRLIKFLHRPENHQKLKVILKSCAENYQITEYILTKIKEMKTEKANFFNSMDVEDIKDIIEKVINLNIPDELFLDNIDSEHYDGIIKDKALSLNIRNKLVIKKMSKEISDSLPNSEIEAIINKLRPNTTPDKKLYIEAMKNATERLRNIFKRLITGLTNTNELLELIKITNEKFNNINSIINKELNPFSEDEKKILGDKNFLYFNECVVFEPSPVVTGENRV